MSKKTMRFVYWLSLVGPVIDVLIGTWKGLVSVYEQCKAERVSQEAEKLYQEQLNKFRSDNNG